MNPAVLDFHDRLLRGGIDAGIDVSRLPCSRWLVDRRRVQSVSFSTMHVTLLVMNTASLLA
jgi:hypothetical protein